MGLFTSLWSCRLGTGAMLKGQLKGAFLPFLTLTMCPRSLFLQICINIAFAKYVLGLLFLADSG